uniref:BTB domain-containing protein n=1 Tax=Romanomermis culicivorax TaxID=13658 RepID=A0A915IW02_ROMCU
MSQIVKLNVGGRKYATSRQTLTRDPDSMLARMFSDDWNYSMPSYKTSTNVDSSSPPCCSSSTVDGAHGDSCEMMKKVSSDQQNDVDEHFIDRDGEHFRFILNFLRDGPSVSLPLDNAGVLHELLREAEYYQLQGLIELLRSKLFSPLRSIKNGEIVK